MRAGAYRCWSAAPCSICAHCSKAWRRCHRRRRSFAASSMSAPRARLAGASRASSRGWIRRPPRASTPTTASEFNGLWRFAMRPADALSRAAARDRESARGYAAQSLGAGPATGPMLHQRLASRFHAMMAAGFLDEVRALHAQGRPHGAPFLDARGRLPPALGASRGRVRPRRGGRAGYCRHAPARQAPAHLDARGNGPALARSRRRTSCRGIATYVASCESLVFDSARMLRLRQSVPFVGEGTYLAGRFQGSSLAIHSLEQLEAVKTRRTRWPKASRSKIPF